MPREETPQTVAVVGAGAVGTTTAFDLATRGVDVTLFERDRVASGSSGRAAGICYDAYADRRDARLAGRALERFRELDVAFRECPYVLLARESDDDNARAIADLAERMASRGVDVDCPTVAALAAEFPDLVTDDVAGAAVARNAGVVDPTTYTERLAERARSAGATVVESTPVELAGPRTLVADGESRAFDAVVVAAGPATKPLLSGVGTELALKCYRAQALVTASLPVDPPTVFDTTGHYYLRPYEGGVLLGDGVEFDVDPTDWERKADPSFVERGREHLRTALGVDATVDRAWAGLCTATPDRDPLVGAVGDGLFVATGWHGHGLMRAPAIGEALAAQVLGDDGITGFSPTRFSGSETFDIAEGMAVEER